MLVGIHFKAVVVEEVAHVLNAAHLQAQISVVILIRCEYLLNTLNEVALHCCVLLQLLKVRQFDQQLDGSFLDD